MVYKYTELCTTCTSESHLNEWFVQKFSFICYIKTVCSEKGNYQKTLWMIAKLLGLTSAQDFQNFVYFLWKTKKHCPRVWNIYHAGLSLLYFLYETQTGVVLWAWVTVTLPVAPCEAGATATGWAPAVRWAATEATGCWEEGRSTASPTAAGLGPPTVAVRQDLLLPTFWLKPDF